MRRTFVAATATMLAVGLSAPAAIAGQGNPSPTGTGPPSQSCQTVYNNGAVVTPGNGNAAMSPGSPFDEPGTNTTYPLGGTGGQNYNAAKSQYDVACYQTNQHVTP